MGDLLTISQVVGIGKCLQHLFGSGTENPRVGAEREPVESAPGNHSHCFSTGYPMGGTRTVGFRVFGGRFAAESVYPSWIPRKRSFRFDRSTAPHDP